VGAADDIEHRVIGTLLHHRGGGRPDVTTNANNIWTGRMDWRWVSGMTDRPSCAKKRGNCFWETEKP